jgi:hypothetical protein
VVGVEEATTLRRGEVLPEGRTDEEELRAISRPSAINEAMTDIFRRGEVLPEGRTAEEEVRAIETQSAPLANQTSAESRMTKPEGRLYLRKPP